VPDLTGMTAGQAVAAITGRGLQALEGEPVIGDCAAVRVVAQQPPPGTSVTVGSTVVYQVCLPDTVPDLTGLTEQAASDLLASLRLEVLLADAEDPPGTDEQIGTVARQEPAPGEPRPADGRVTIYLYRSSGEPGDPAGGEPDDEPTTVALALAYVPSRDALAGQPALA
jgi:beta-lactam-binding protein with PASTA domain